MRFAIFATVVFVSSVVGQTMNDVPACARGCIEASTKKVTNCKWGDLKCSCKTENREKILSDSLQCVVNQCGLDVAISKSLCPA